MHTVFVFYCKHLALYPFIKEWLQWWFYQDIMADFPQTSSNQIMNFIMSYKSQSSMITNHTMAYLSSYHHCKICLYLFCQTLSTTNLMWVIYQCGARSGLPQLRGWYFEIEAKSLSRAHILERRTNLFLNVVHLTQCHQIEQKLR